MVTCIATLQHLLAMRWEHRSDTGATMVEYGLLLTLIAVVVAVAAATLGTQIAALFTTVSNDF